ncbi:MAG: O-sialoglycoprotein endopeptidase [Clostridiales bacterium]|jgi:N6-L-threonylcarbamoyladenine synthase|nr:O-sialoglycoprotein endopeptidase [Clostridiales bacterium]
MTETALGIDTSCYTTSVALAGAEGIAVHRRKLLEVEGGARGLRQSDALFQHVNRLPELLEEMLSEAGDISIRAVCASARPRDVEGSYMPVFLAGLSFARSIAAALRVPKYETSHQQGHVRAALVGSGLADEEFLAAHLSGGTTEMLRVRPGLHIGRLAGSSDLHAGQFVDRVGVRMGLPFPAGPALEKLARLGEARSAMPLAHRDGDVSFSGAEAEAMRMLDAGARPEDVAAEVFSYLVRAVARLISDAYRRTRLASALISGGVASSGLLRELLPARLSRLDCPVNIHWGAPELSGDNACGVALIGWEEFCDGKHH